MPVYDADGNYAISVKAGEVLKLSFIGMKTQMVTVGDSSTVNVTMTEDLEDLDTVVITGYQNVKRELFTGASQTIKAKDIKGNTNCHYSAQYLWDGVLGSFHEATPY